MPRVPLAKWNKMSAAQKAKVRASLKTKGGYPKNSNYNKGEYKPSRFSGSQSNPITMLRELPLFGLRTRRSIPYLGQVSLTGTASAVNAYVFSVNGCYDPDITSTGHQPMGFDSLMLFYNHYTVLGAKIKITCQNTSVTTSHVAISISGSSTVTTDTFMLLENGQAAFAILTPAGVAGSIATLSTYCNCAKFQGMSPKLIMADPNMRGDAASNPAEQMYFHISTWNPVSAAVPSVYFDVNIEYDVIFHEPRKATPQ